MTVALAAVFVLWTLIQFLGALFLFMAGMAVLYVVVLVLMGKL